MGCYYQYNLLQNIPLFYFVTDIFIVTGKMSRFQTHVQIVKYSYALVSFKKYMPPPLPYFKVNICPFLLSHFASIFFAYLWSFRWPNYIVTLPRYFSFRLPHLNIPTGLPSDELDKNIQRTSFGLLFSHWNGYSHFGLRWIFHMYSEFSRPAMCNNAIMIISSQM